MSPSVEPFNEAKYKDLTDGLEISEMKLSELNGDLRFDSEYYQKRYLADALFLDQRNAKPIRLSVTDGQHGYHELDGESPIHMLTAKNAKFWFADLDNADRIAKWVNDNNLRSALCVDDLVLSTRGTVGSCAIVKKEILPANLDQDLARIRIVDRDYLPEFILTYFNCRYGKNWMRRNQTGMVQQGLALRKVHEIPIPPFSADFQNFVKSIVDSAYRLLHEAGELYDSAKRIVDVCFPVNCPATGGNIGIKTSSESFHRSGRLDAEYYQPKYDEIMEALHPTETVGSVCKLHDENFIPDSDRSYRYIELANVGSVGQISGVEQISGSELPSRARRRIRQGQVIVSSIEGSLSSCALIDEEFDGALCSTGFFVVDSNRINSETLLVLFKSFPVQSLMKQRCSGTILTAISKSEFLQMPFPMIDEEAQREIRKKIRESFRLRKEAKRLLDGAIRTVERAIETDEFTALKRVD